MYILSPSGRCPNNHYLHVKRHKMHSMQSKGMDFYYIKNCVCVGKFNVLTTFNRMKDKCSCISSIGLCFCISLWVI